MATTRRATGSIIVVIVGQMTRLRGTLASLLLQLFFARASRLAVRSTSGM
jgi:hypothetical protein